MKKRILLSETGGTLTRNVIMSLRASGQKYHIIGVTSHPYEIALSNADESYLVPGANSPEFIPALVRVAQKTRAQFLHSQHDAVIKVLARNRDKIGIPMFLPDTKTIEYCVDKYKSWERWHEAGIPVAQTMEIRRPADITTAFATFGKTIWLRLKEGGGGAGSAPVTDAEFARHWIEYFQGWGKFTASEMLSPESITWSSIWKNGKLIVAQGRKRLYWLFANRTISGVTGVTGAAVTVRDSSIDTLAQRAIRAIDPAPHGIFSVDMTYDAGGNPRVTEINIGRFFTTIHFFTAAGLNMPDMFVRLAFSQTLPRPGRGINPVPPGLMWIRGMDTAPVLISKKRLDRFKTTS